jgi:hypothetical protein
MELVKGVRKNWIGRRGEREKGRREKWKRGDEMRKSRKVGTRGIMEKYAVSDMEKAQFALQEWIPCQMGGEGVWFLRRSEWFVSTAQKA